MTLLSQQVAVITGAAAGIGWETATRLLEEGASVVLSDVNELPSTETITAAGFAPDRVLSIRGDVSVRTDVELLIQAAERKHGRIDVLVNNAGVAQPLTDVHTMDDAIWNRILAVNLTGQYLVAKAVVRLMRSQRSGRIINISSELALCGAPQQAAYCAAKAGVVGLTKALALELAAFGITVNCVAPGPTDTQMLEDWERTDEMRAHLPLGRFGQPADIAGAILHFAGPEAGWTTGQTLSPNGGLVM